MQGSIQAYNYRLEGEGKIICDHLFCLIQEQLQDAESKIRHRHPVWFLEGNPIVGYHQLKDCVRLLFWSGQSFDEPGLTAEGSFKAAEKRYTHHSQIDESFVVHWLTEAKRIQRDYKNIVKRRGKLEKKTDF